MAIKSQQVNDFVDFFTKILAFIFKMWYNETMSKELLIAIDGPSASGKGSLAEKIAQHFNLGYLNTGALYRIAANRYIELGLTEQSLEENIARLVSNIDSENFENPILFTEKVGEVASKIAKNPKLRAALFDFQQQFVKDSVAKTGGVVMDGRDIASKIMPNATHKFFITASVEERAKRRYLQLKEKGDDVNFDEILAQLKTRDENDKNRASSPLVIDPNAIVIDNSDLTKEQTLAKVLGLI